MEVTPVMNLSLVSEPLLLNLIVCVYLCVYILKKKYSSIIINKDIHAFKNCTPLSFQKYF